MQQGGEVMAYGYGYRRKWVPNRAQKEAFKEQLKEQEASIAAFCEATGLLMYANDNKSSYYLTIDKDAQGQRVMEVHRISTHSLPGREYKPFPGFKPVEHTVRARKSLIDKAWEIAESYGFRGKEA